jgi:hypothetical protein
MSERAVDLHGGHGRIGCLWNLGLRRQRQGHGGQQEGNGACVLAALDKRGHRYGKMNENDSHYYSYRWI